MGNVIVYLLRCSNFRSHIEIIRHFICNNYLICKYLHVHSRNFDRE